MSLNVTPQIEALLIATAQEEGIDAATLTERLLIRHAHLVCEIDEHTKWSCASLRLFSQTLTSAQISEALETQPSLSYEIGDLVSKRSAKKTFRKSAFWSLESPLSTDEPLDHHLLELIGFAERKAPILARLRFDCTADLFCGFSSGNGQGGFLLEPDTLVRLGALDLDLNVDLYPPSDFKLNNRPTE